MSHSALAPVVLAIWGSALCVVLSVLLAASWIVRVLKRHDPTPAVDAGVLPFRERAG